MSDYGKPVTLAMVDGIGNSDGGLLEEGSG
jgi:hypothetical protein